MKMKFINLSVICLISSMVFMSCKKESLQKEATVTVVKAWTIPLSSKFQVPAVNCNVETGTVKLELFSDNSIKYNINVKDIEMGDELVAAHIHEGNVLENGSIVLGFMPMFSYGTATGTLLNIRQSFVDSLKSDLNELYFNVHSKKHPKGIVRGQLNVGIELADDVVLKGSNQVPAINTTATGLGLLRLTSDKKLYSLITVKDLEMVDKLLVAHIHKGAAGVNGPVIISLCMNADDFGKIKINTLSDANFSTVKSDYIYVNAHSEKHPGGIVRGQVNN